jgi:hypothetical protein
MALLPLSIRFNSLKVKAFAFWFLESVAPKLSSTLMTRVLTPETPWSSLTLCLFNPYMMYGFYRSVSLVYCKFGAATALRWLIDKQLTIMVLASFESVHLFTNRRHGVERYLLSLSERNWRCDMHSTPKVCVPRSRLRNNIVNDALSNRTSSYYFWKLGKDTLCASLDLGRISLIRFLSSLPLCYKINFVMSTSWQGALW